MSGRPGTDAELVGRARKGDLGAFDRLVMRHRARLYGIARQITGQSEAAQDVVQDAFVNAFRSVGALRDGDRFGKWLNTIVRRESTRWLRNGRREAGWAEPGALQAVIGGAWTRPAEAPVEVVSSVRDALGVLSDRDRRVMILHYLEGYTCEEVADHLGLAASSVRRILSTSRRAVRKECQAMAETQRKGPRRLNFWISGSVPPGRWNIFEHMRPVLAQSVCLAANKEPKALGRIADEVKADVEYVRDTAGDLEQMTALVESGRGRYATSFITLEAEDWRKFIRLVPEPAAKAAEQFGAAEGRLRGVFEKTPLARSGWTWDKVIWVIYAVQLANTAMCRALRQVWDAPAPERPGGGWYWMAGREDAPGVPGVWNVGLNAHSSSAELETGYFWTWGIKREEEEMSLVSDPGDRHAVLRGLAEGVAVEDELIARVPRGPEPARAALADLVRLKMAARDADGYRLNIPFFTEADSEVLTPEVDAVAGAVVEAVYEPALAGLESQFDQMGYGRHRDQYAAWRYWLASNISGEALRFLVEQGVLPGPPDPAPGNFAHLAWKAGIELMRWR